MSPATAKAIREDKMNGKEVNPVDHATAMFVLQTMKPAEKRRRKTAYDRLNDRLAARLEAACEGLRA